jgi:acyl-CoA-binding protein
MACSVFAGSKLDMHRDEALFEKQALTLYSLYKQCKEGDADEFESNRKRTDPDKL